MRSYSIKLTIKGLHGAFAEKYAHTISNAQYLHCLFEQTSRRDPGGPFTFLAARREPIEFDPFPAFSRAMRLLRYSAHDRAEQRFFTGVRLEPPSGEPSEWAPVIDWREANQLVTLHAFGTKAIRVVGDSAPMTEDLSSTDGYTSNHGVYRLRYDTWSNLFKADLNRLVEMFEEAMAKVQPLICTTI